MRTTINEIIIHCTFTPDDMDIGVEEIDKWHARKGWKSESGVACGYHRVIRRDGSVEWGRRLTEMGAHTKGRNVYTIAICMVGGMGDDGLPDCNFTWLQWAALENELTWMCSTKLLAWRCGHSALICQMLMSMI